MSTLRVEILETRLEPGGVGCTLALPHSSRPAAGQYLLAFCAEAGDLLPAPLFPSSLPSYKMTFSAPVPVGWNAGMTLALRGPLGHGFQLLPGPRRVALAALGDPPGALLPRAQSALAGGGEVALYARGAPPNLPPQVEVLPLDLLPEAPGWAHYLAIDAPLAQLADLPHRLGVHGFHALGCTAQVLARATMPCAGAGTCGVCAVPTRRGWRLACKDGPVFAWEALGR
jgi:hypothetical protein